MFFPDVVNAMFRRAPGRIEAENYSHDGPNQSYFVRDAAQLSKYYRTSEPVPVEPISGVDRWSSQQGIRLTEREWTAYAVESLAGRDYSVVVRAKAEAGPAVCELTINGRTQELAVPQGDWCEVSGKPAALSQGTNRIKVLIRSGVVHLDWISVN